MARGAPYREPAREDARGPLEAPVLHRAVRSAHALGSAAVGGVFGAAMMGSLELAVLAGAGALAASAQWVRAATQRRRHAALSGFLGTDVVHVAHGTWTTPDGRRRLRAVAGDEEARFERLDPVTGETLESFRGPAAVAPAPAEDEPAVWRLVATLHGRPTDPRCFLGLPPQLGGRFARLGEAARVVVEVRRAGVLVERRDADGGLVGDTWHADLDSAKRQLRHEFGDHLGRLREATSEPADDDDPVTSSWDAASVRHLAL